MKFMENVLARGRRGRESRESEGSKGERGGGPAYSTSRSLKQ